MEGVKVGAGRTALKPQHHSVLQRMTAPKPRGLAKMNMEPAARTFIEQEALEIFAEMTNSGATFQQSLAAVFLSGMSAGHNAKVSGAGTASAGLPG